MELGENIRKLLLAGIGTAAVTMDKSKEILDDLVKKGELTVEQGKVLNQELRHDFREKVKSNIHVSVKPSSPDELKDLLDRMTPEQLEALKEQLKNMDAEAGEDASAAEQDAAANSEGETVNE